MSDKLVSSQHVPRSVLFPGLYKEVVLAIELHFPVLVFPCLRPLLDKFAEQMTEKIISYRQEEFPEELFVDLDEVHGRDLERIDTFVISERGKISQYDVPYIAKIGYSKIYFFARDQILAKENTVPFYLSEEDIALITMILVHVTEVSSNWESHFLEVSPEKMFRRWFVET